MSLYAFSRRADSSWLTDKAWCARFTAPGSLACHTPARHPAPALLLCRDDGFPAAAPRFVHGDGGEAGAGFGGGGDQGRARRPGSIEAGRRTPLESMRRKHCVIIARCCLRGLVMLTPVAGRFFPTDLRLKRIDPIQNSDEPAGPLHIVDDS